MLGRLVCAGPFSVRSSARIQLAFKIRYFDVTDSVHRIAEKTPEHRFQSASDLACALEALSQAKSVADGCHHSVNVIESSREQYLFAYTRCERARK
jgi:hypothetical protein